MIWGYHYFRKHPYISIYIYAANSQAELVAAQVFLSTISFFGWSGGGIALDMLNMLGMCYETRKSKKKWTKQLAFLDHDRRLVAFGQKGRSFRAVVPLKILNGYS